ncbi:hypothetical protein GCM10008936_04760 [Alkalibacterium indicireducens]|uniref:Sulfate exporter family transporter n=1 Tax=Alkalibacterium indicireducens TaxID=398758 RepID=A0ABP3KE34_9LACT
MSLQKLFPWFIACFVLFAGLNTIGLIPVELSGAMRQASRFLMVIALAAIGLKTNVRQFARTGWKPFVHAIILSSLVVVVSFAVVAIVL